MTDIETAVSTLHAATRTIPITSICDISTTHTPDPEPTESKPETDPTPYCTALLTSDDLASKWAADVASYFQRELMSDILERSGRWILEQFDEL